MSTVHTFPTMSRRGFLGVAASALALGLAGCDESAPTDGAETEASEEVALDTQLMTTLFPKALLPTMPLFRLIHGQTLCVRQVSFALAAYKLPCFSHCSMRGTARLAGLTQAFPSY